MSWWQWGIVAGVAGVAGWRLGWRQGHNIARYQAAVDAVLDPAIDHSDCIAAADRLSKELAAESHKVAALIRYSDRLEAELDRLRGDRPLITPESLAIEELIEQFEQEFPS
jgi:hypothetical protein